MQPREPSRRLHVLGIPRRDGIRFTKRAGRRLAVRLVTAAVVLGAVDAAVRAHEDALEQVFFTHYRLPSVAVPPLAEVAAALERRRARVPSRLYVGMAGPSFIHGVGVDESQTLPAQLQARFDVANAPVTIVNLALPGNRYDDDRILAQRFAGLVDVVLVPYTPQLAQWAANDCPKHLDIVEWTSPDPAPFGVPSGCREPPRHLVNTWIDGWITSSWATYAHRAALRKELFPSTGDFGRAAYESVHGAVGRTNGHLATIDGRPPSLMRLGAAPPASAPPASAPPASAPPELAAQVDRLCDAYEARGTRVVFYRFPELEQPGQGARPLELYRALDAVVRARAARDPKSAVLDFDGDIEPADCIDPAHPRATGFAKLADQMAVPVLWALGVGRELP